MPDITSVSMHNLSANDKVELEQVIKSAEVYLDLHNQGQRFAAETQRQHDSIAVWIVGICAGAVLALSPILDSFVDKTDIAKWQLMVLYAFFVLGVLLGIVHRCFLAQMMDADKFSAFTKTTLASTAILKEIHTPQDIKDMKNDLISVIDGTNQDLKNRRKSVDDWKWWVDRIQFIPMLMLALGVLTFALIALNQN